MILGLTPLVFAAMVFVVGLILKDTLMTIAEKIFGAFIVIIFFILACKAGAVDGSKERGR